MPVRRNIREIKAGLRAEYRKMREEIPEPEKRRLDALLCRKLFSLREYESNGILFIYVAKPQEIATAPIIEDALSKRKVVVVPRCVPGTREMEFYRIAGFADLARGSFGVLEPIPEKCEKYGDYTHGLCVLPGFCFDRYGYRLGYGKGYYDRFLSSFSGVTAGLCYASFVVAPLPHGYFDRHADILVTEKYIRRIRPERKKQK